jgi:methylphosphotriester-DNA--protein-cysteine methyltransferase
LVRLQATALQAQQAMLRCCRRQPPPQALLASHAWPAAAVHAIQQVPSKHLLLRPLAQLQQAPALAHAHQALLQQQVQEREPALRL